jgi:3',5'-cyclic-AMP phosphodiesterase
VSWKFKPLGEWSLVMITTPADQAFIIDPTQPDQVVRGMTEVRAKAWDAEGIVSANCRIDDGSWQPMWQIGTGAMCSCTWDSSQAADGPHGITVLARCADGRTATDTISVLTSQSGRYNAPARKPGDSANPIGA